MALAKRPGANQLLTDSNQLSVEQKAFINGSKEFAAPGEDGAKDIITASTWLIDNLKSSGLEACPAPTAPYNYSCIKVHVSLLECMPCCEAPLFTYETCILLAGAECAAPAN